MPPRRPPSLRPPRADRAATPRQPQARGPAAPAAPRAPPPRASAHLARAAGARGQPVSDFQFSDADEIELHSHLSARWLPFDHDLATQALRMSRALVSPRTSGRSTGRAAVPYYRALMSLRLWRRQWRGPPPAAATPAARGANGAHNAAVWPRARMPFGVPAPVGGGSPMATIEEALAGAAAGGGLFFAPLGGEGRAQVEAMVRRMRAERAECERSLAAPGGGAAAPGRGLSAWRKETLALQAEELSRDIAALERLLRWQESGRA